MKLGEKIWLAVLLALVVIAYLPSINGEFINDEYLLILNNPKIQQTESLKKFFTEHFWGGKARGIYYRPLVNLSYVLNWKISKENPLSYHLFNLLFHLFNIFLFYNLMKKLFPDLAIGASFIFALHPALNEGVAWIPGRPELLASFFVLTGWILWLSTEEKNKNLKKIVYLGVGLSFLLALFSKENGIILVLLVLVYDFWKGGKKGFKDELNKHFYGYIFMGLSLGIYLFLRQSALKGEAPLPAELFLAQYPIWQKPFVIARLFLEYLGIELFPHPLYPDYHYTHKFSAQNYPFIFFLGYGIFWVIALTVIAIGLRKRNNLSLLAIFWLLALLPFSHIFSYPTALALRFLYLPTMFFALFLFGLIQALKKFYPLSGRIILGAMILFLSLLSFSQSQIYRSRIGYFNQAVQLAPMEKVLHNQRGLALMAKAQLFSAEKEFIWALTLDPNYPEAMNNLARLSLRQGDISSALLLLEKALAISEDYADAHFNLGLVYRTIGKLDRARAELKKSAELDPENPLPRYQLGRIALEQGEIDEAKQELELLLEIAGWHLGGLKLRAEIAIAEQDWRTAKTLLDKARRIAPQDAELKELTKALPD